MTDFANQSEKVEILQCKNGMLAQKLHTWFLVVFKFIKLIIKLRLTGHYN